MFFSATTQNTKGTCVYFLLQVGYTLSGMLCLMKLAFPSINHISTFRPKPHLCLKLGCEVFLNLRWLKIQCPQISYLLSLLLLQHLLLPKFPRLAHLCHLRMIRLHFLLLHQINLKMSLRCLLLMELGVLCVRWVRNLCL